MYFPPLFSNSPSSPPAFHQLLSVSPMSYRAAGGVLPHVCSRAPSVMLEKQA